MKRSAILVVLILLSLTHGDMSVPFNSCQLTGGCEVEKTDGMG